MDECKNRAAEIDALKDSLERATADVVKFAQDNLNQWSEIQRLKADNARMLESLSAETNSWTDMQAENAALKAEVAHWKANHANMVNRSRILIDRPDLPLERVKAFKKLETLKAENDKLRNAASRILKCLRCETVIKDIEREMDNLDAAMATDTNGE